jgi:alkyl sulfatase BDS1-like metallo-beta-lactamase superfamily hydrolase
MVVAGLCVSGCSDEGGGMRHADFGPDADAAGHSAATEFTARANAAVAQQLELDDARDFELANRSLLAREDDLVVKSADGQVIWRPADYDFIEGDAPPSVNPSLWRQAKLNNIHGLFEVTKGVYQVRGYDLANMSIIEGREGWILVDPLTAFETARAALDLVQSKLGKRPISAIIFTHSHIDHFGGVFGVADKADIESGKVRVIAPKGFTEESVSENVVAGIVMTRRADFMFGAPLARSERGHVGSGLGKHPPFGRVSIAAPTDIVDRTMQEMTIDGVRFVFQYAPDSEAPAELAFYLPDHRALCGAEIVSRTMHNLYTLRGAKVRDALQWSGYIDEMIELFGDRTDVVFNSHHWPVWDTVEIRDYLEKQRDTYKYIHDQTLHLAALGHTPREIAEIIELPDVLQKNFAGRGYYGTLKHNAKAVYQHYFGWYDGNPANLDPLVPEDAAKRYVEAIGGMSAIIEKSQQAYDKGEYRWAAELLNHAVFAEPGNDDARALLAKAYDQAGYRAESGPWRDIYLTGATELRHGVTKKSFTAAAGDIINAVPLHLFFTAMATRVNGPKADGKHIKVNFIFTDTQQTFVLEVKNGVLHHDEREPDDDADATITLTRQFWLRLLTKQAGAVELLATGDYEIEGARLKVLALFGLLEEPNESFDIVTP